jgi:ElaB/YqjD/DUF883 family membrane-anchored ribosome-binding protein
MANETDDPEVIRRRMLENRTALTEKLEALENQVLGVASSVTNTVESVKEGVQETVEAVKDTVQETVGNVKETFDDTVETVKETFDLRRQVERHPWAMLGGSLAVGALLGVLLRRRTMRRVAGAAESVARRFRRAPAPAPQPLVQETGNGARKEPGLADSLIGSAREGLTRVKDMALGTLFGTIQELVARELPKAVEEHVKTFVDDAMTRLKEAVKPQPQPAPAAETAAREQPRRKRGRQETGFDPQTGRPLGRGSW